MKFTINDLGITLLVTTKREYGPYDNKPNLPAGGYDADLVDVQDGEAKLLGISHEGHTYKIDPGDCKIHGRV